MPLGKHDDSWHKLECTKCGYKHQMRDRERRYVDGFTQYHCPKCGEESYYNLTVHKGE